MEMKAFTIVFLFLSLCALIKARPNIHSLELAQNALEDDIIDDKTSLTKPNEEDIDGGELLTPSPEEDKYEMPPIEMGDIIPAHKKPPPFIKHRPPKQIDQKLVETHPYTNIVEDTDEEIPPVEDFYLRNVLKPPHDFTSRNTENAKFPLHLNVEDRIIQLPEKFKESDIKMTPLAKPSKTDEFTTETLAELRNRNEEIIIKPTEYFLIRATPLPESSSTSSHFTTRKVEKAPVMPQTPLPNEAKPKEIIPQLHQNLIVQQEQNKSQSTKKPEQEQKAVDLKGDESSYLDLLFKAIKLTLKEAEKISGKEQVLKNVKYQTHQASCRKRSHHLSNKSENNMEIDKQQEDKVSPTFIDKISMYIVNIVYPEKRVHKKNVTLIENHSPESANTSPTTTAPKPIQINSTPKTSPTTSTPKTSPTTSTPKPSPTTISTTKTINPTTSAPKPSQINSSLTLVTSDKKEDISIKHTLKSFPAEVKQVQNKLYSNDRKLISKLNTKYEILPKWYSSVRDPMNSIIRNPWLLRRNDFVLPRNRISLLNKFSESNEIPYVNPESLSLNFREKVIPADNYLNLIQPKSLSQVSENFPNLWLIPNNLRRYIDIENIFNRPNIKKIGKENELFQFRFPFSKNIKLSYKNEEKPILSKKKLNIDAVKKIAPAIIETGEIIIDKNLNSSPDSNKNDKQLNIGETKTKDCSTSKPKSSVPTVDKTEPQANSNNALNNNNSDQIKPPTSYKKLSYRKAKDNKLDSIMSKDIAKEWFNLPSLYNSYFRNQVIREKQNIRNEPINYNDMLGIFPPYLF